MVAYCGGGEPKKHGSARHEAVETPPIRNPLPLHIAGSDKVGNEDAYATDPGSVWEPQQARDGTGCSPYITHPKNIPMTDACVKLILDIQGGPEYGRRLRRWWKKERRKTRVGNERGVGVE